MSNALAVTDASFAREVLDAKIPVLVDFWAEWCGPCKQVAPIIEELAADYEGRIKVVKVDTDANPVTPGTYGVMGIPTLMLFEGGELVERVVGFQPKPKLVAILERFATAEVTGAPQAAGAAVPEPVPAVTMHPITVTDTSFREMVIDSELPVLVDFWASWCSPCKMIAPSLEELAAEFAGRAIIAKIDVDANPVTPGMFGVMGIPTLLLFQGGSAVDRVVGYQPKPKLRALLEGVAAPVGA